MTTVEDWFGAGFADLHPLLQRLHRDGGLLRGQVDVSFGRGLAGFFGKRLAARLGVPAVAGPHDLQVSIHSAGGVLHWSRSFDGQTQFCSEFRPVGHYPTGYWTEQTGPLSLALGVRVLAGGWHWEHRRTRLFGLAVPKALFPGALASKRIEGELYRFAVEVSAPVLGKLLGYSGNLAAVNHTSIQTAAEGDGQDAGVS